MATKEFDPFDWDTGLVDDVDFTIEEARFTYNAKIRNGEVLLLSIKGKAVDHESGDVVEDELEQFYACGEGWESYDGGTRARREDGRTKSFNNRTAIVSLVVAACDAGAKSALAERGGPLVSTIWEGLTLHMRQVETDYGGEIGKRSRLLPVKLLDGGTKGKGGKGAKNVPAPVPSPHYQPADGDVSGNVSAALKAKLTALAARCANHDEFIDKAFTEIDGVDGNAAAMDLVVNPAAIYEPANA